MQLARLWAETGKACEAGAILHEALQSLDPRAPAPIVRQAIELSEGLPPQP
jgi:hypothetical protein